MQMGYPRKMRMAYYYLFGLANFKGPDLKFERELHVVGHHVERESIALVEIRINTQ